MGENMLSRTNNSYPRLLVVSPPAFTGMYSSKTITTLFRNWPKESMAQLFIYDESPSYEVCEKFYRITDLDIMNANLKWSKAEGKAFTIADIGAKPKERFGNIHGWKRTLALMLSRRNSLVELLRDIAWRKSKWLSPKLIRWIDEYNPQAVFLWGTSQPFFHKMAHWICTHYKIPLFLYSTDDFTYCTSVYNPIAWLNYFRYMKYFKKSMCLANKSYVISSGMKKEYRGKFATADIELLMTCTPTRTNITSESLSQRPLRLTYAGNLYMGRWEVLSELADCLLELHTQGFSVKLNVYSSSPPADEIMEKLIKPPVLSYEGTLSQSELNDEINKSNVLIHVESFEKKYIKGTRLSISTKISEYLGSRRTILAIGPEQVESMKYLKENEVALCINSMDKSVMTEKLKAFLFDTELRSELLRNAEEVVAENHDMAKVQDGLYRDLCEVNTR